MSDSNGCHEWGYWYPHCLSMSGHCRQSPASIGACISLCNHFSKSCFLVYIVHGVHLMQRCGGEIWLRRVWLAVKDKTDLLCAYCFSAAMVWIEDKSSEIVTFSAHTSACVAPVRLHFGSVSVSLSPSDQLLADLGLLCVCYVKHMAQYLKNQTQPKRHHCMTLYVVDTHPFSRKVFCLYWIYRAHASHRDSRWASVSNQKKKKHRCDIQQRFIMLIIYSATHIPYSLKLGGIPFWPMHKVQDWIPVHSCLCF